MKRLMTLLAPVLAVTCLAVAGPISPASAVTSVGDTSKLAFPPRGKTQCRAHTPLKLRGVYIWRTFIGRHGKGRTSNVRPRMRLRGRYTFVVCLEAHRRTYEVEARITNSRTGGTAVNRQLLFKRKGAAADYDWGTEIVHR